MNIETLEYQISNLLFQGNKLIVQYLREQLTDETPYVVFCIEQDYGSEANYYFFLVNEETKNKIPPSSCYPSCYNICKHLTKSKEILNPNRFFCMLHNFNGLAIIDKDKILVTKFVEVSKRKHEWQFVELKE